jgi:hypothetical protein
MPKKLSVSDLLRREARLRIGISKARELVEVAGVPDNYTEARDISHGVRRELERHIDEKQSGSQDTETPAQKAFHTEFRRLYVKPPYHPSERRREIPSDQARSSHEPVRPDPIPADPHVPSAEEERSPSPPQEPVKAREEKEKEDREEAARARELLLAVARGESLEEEPEDSEFPVLTETEAQELLRWKDARVYAVYNPESAYGVFVGRWAKIRAKWRGAEGEGFHTVAQARAALQPRDQGPIRIRGAFV